MPTAAELVDQLCRFPARVAGSDAERRAAVWLRDELRAQLPAGELNVALQPTWVRPDWPAAYALDAALGVAGSILCVPLPAAGLAVIVVALVSLLGDLSGSFAILRRLTPARATQNVLVTPAGDAQPGGGRVRLLLVANIDAGRCGAVYRDGWVRLEARLRRALRGRLPNPLALLAAALTVLTGVAAARLAGAGGTAIGIVQLFPTLLLALAVAVLVDAALSEVSTGACANASGVATALAALEALRALPPRKLDVHVLLAGAGDAAALGVRSFMATAARRAGWRAEDVAVVALEPCGAGPPVFYTHAGPFARRLHPQLVAHARAAAAAEPQLGARPWRDHGAGPAFAARSRGWPAIAVGSRDGHDRPGPARQAADLPAGVQEDSLDGALALCLGLVHRLDGALQRDGPASGEAGGAWRRRLGRYGSRRRARRSSR